MSDYFERIEAHLLDAVEREALLRGGRSREAGGGLRNGARARAAGRWAAPLERCAAR